LSGDTLAFHFNYSDGAFRNTMHYDRSRKEWLIHYESQNKNGRWESFGDERLQHI
jgi:hypothetical protein